MKLTKEEARELARDGRVAGYEFVDSELYDTSRWSTHHTLIIKRLSDDTYWRDSYTQGATESQFEAPFEYSDPDFHQVMKVTESTEVWKPIDEVEINTEGLCVMITADWNDGDYITSNTMINSENVDFVINTMEKLIDLLKDEREINHQNFPIWSQDQVAELYPELTQQELDTIEAMLPSAQDAQYIHSIGSIKIVRIEETPFKSFK